MSDLHPGNVLVYKYYVKRKAHSLLTKIYNSVVSHVSPSSSTPSTIDRIDNVTEDNIEMEVKRQIVFLDAGIAVQLDEETKQNLLDLFRAVVLNDGKGAGRMMVERAKYERCSSVAGGVESFSDGIGDIVSEFHDRRKEGLTLGAVRIGTLLTRVLDLCRIHGVEIDPAMANVIISTLVLEGLGRSLEPSLNLIDFAMPFILAGGRI
jgi:aarF domain-containing kinase